jgi:3-dehydroquinate synthase
MEPHVRTINVELGERSYRIMIEPGIIDRVGAGLTELGFSGRVAVVTNTLVQGLYAERVTKGIKDAGLTPVVIAVDDGEQHKTLDTASKIYDGLIEHRMERTSPVVALGGGVVGDVAGFVAATYLRGVPYVQVPTTLLAQVDSSVGGKTAVNHKLGKNLIGAFYQPRGVFIDPETLSTLDKREFRAGLAEVVKYGIIWDSKFFEFLEKNPGSFKGPSEGLIGAIERSCEIKAEVVGADERETGLRSILNFGHTFGHAIETQSGYGTFLHGEAVSLGMVMAAEFSVKLGLCEAGVEKRIEALLSSLELPVNPPALSGNLLIDSMKLDKKVTGARMRFVLTSGIGKVFLREVAEEELKLFFTEFNL